MVTASKRFTIHRSSNVLTLSLKRFANFSGGKITKDVKYPEYLDLHPFMSQTQGEPQVYGLYAVLVHSGFSCHAGHYFCYIKASNGQWYQMNDSSVSVSDIRSVLNQQAYVLFYIKSSDMKKTGEYGHMNHTPGIPGQSSPRPVVVPRINSTVHHNNIGFIGPQLPPHMTKNTLHVNGNGSLRNYPTSSKPSTSSGMASSSSISHSISRPTGIPDHDKRQKLSFFIGQGKQNRPSSTSSSYSQLSSGSSSSSSSSLSSSQSTSDVHFVPRQVSQVNGTSFSNGDHHNGNGGNGASFLVPYSQESSEDSDQESSGTLDNGYSAKSHLNGNSRTAGNVFDNSPEATNGESGGHHNFNGLNGSTYDICKSSQNGHHYGHHKINGHNTHDKLSGNINGSSSSVVSVASNGIDSNHSQTSKEAQNSASSQTNSTWSTHPVSESQQISTPDTRANNLSEPLPQHTASSTVSSPPLATTTKTHSVTSRELASSSAHHGKPAALSTPIDISQSTSGSSAAPQKVNIGGDEDIYLPQTNGPSAGTERFTDAKEQHQSKPSYKGNERRCSRDRERNRLNSDWTRDRERHYRDRSRERDNEGDRHRYRRDNRDYHHRSNRDHSPPYNHNNRDREPERHRDRTMHHPRERDRDRGSNHYHHQRSREDVDRERRGRAYSCRKEPHSHRRWQQDGRDFLLMKDKGNGRERDYYPSKGEIYSPATVTEISLKAKGSSPRAPLSISESVSNKEDHNHKRIDTVDNRSKERDDSCEARHAKKHKKSKKKKKSKDKDRHRESGSSDVDSETKKKKKKKRRHRDGEAEQRSSGAAQSLKSRITEEREIRKRRYYDIKDSKYESGLSPEKRRRTDYSDGSSYVSPTNGLTYHHLNGYTGNGYSRTNGDSHRLSSDLKH